MPYYFECTYCNNRLQIDEYSGGYQRSCEDCGEDLCECCINPDDKCNNCTYEEDDKDV